MTSTLTLSCPYGIVLAADQRCTILQDNGPKYLDNVDKIFRVKKLPIALSFWGTTNFGSKDLNEYLEDFYKQKLSQDDDVNSIADKLKNSLENIEPEIDASMGFHLAGYCKNEEGDYYPQLRHVFHETWVQNGKFVNENSNQEYHRPDGQRIQYEYDPYIALFNGNRAVANLYFYSLPTIYPNGTRIILDLLDLDQCTKLAKLIVTSSGEILNFLHYLDQTEPYKGVSGVMIARITNDRVFQWVEKSRYNRIKSFLGKF